MAFARCWASLPRHLADTVFPHNLSALVIKKFKMLKPLICIMISATVSSATAGTTHEFYKGSQYPGKDLRPNEELREVVKPGGGPREYARR